MITMEQVEKLRAKANVSYDEAKSALEASNGDMLDAIIYLERQGKVMPPENDGFYRSDASSEQNAQQETRQKNDTPQYETFKQTMGRFGRWLRKLVARGNENFFEVRKEKTLIMSMPVTALVVLLIFAFWFVVPVLVVGLFFGWRYQFRGADLEKTGVNNVMDSAADAAENIKKDVKDS